MCLLAICISSFMRFLKSFAHFKNLGCVSSNYEVVKALVCLDTNPLPNICIANIFSKLWLVFSFPFYLFIYLFIWLRWVLVAASGLLIWGLRAP